MKADEFDSIIFDCDGVLIDVTNSYDTTINKTISYVLKEIADITVDAPLTNEILLSFKSTGGFNDEIDITYSGILCFIAAKKLNKDPAELILDILNNADDTGIAYIEDFLNKIDVDIADIKSRLGYPSTDKNDLIHATFDQLFFGPELYSKIFQKESKFSEKGFIENDNVIVNSELIEALKEKFNDKIAIVTGRGFNAISSSLKEILNQFNVENSVFLEDESRDLAKPNPQSLIRAMKVPQKVALKPNSEAFCAKIMSSIESPTYRQFFELRPFIALISDCGFGLARSRDSSSRKTEFSTLN